MAITRNCAPEWLKNLPAGKYDSHQLQEITGLNMSSIDKTIIRYGAKVEKVYSGYKNLFKNIYIWKGYKEPKKEEKKKK